MEKMNPLTASEKKQAFALFQENRFQDAKSRYERICELDPADAEAWFFLGIANGQLGDLAQAEACLRRAADLEPFRPEIHLNLGNILNQLEKYSEAEASYRDALRLAPQMAFAHANLATALQKQGRLDEALIEHQATVRLAPALPEAHFNLGNLQKELGQLPEAEAAYREALRLNPNLAEAHDGLGSVLRRQKRYKESLRAHREAVRLKPDFAVAYFNLGGLLENLGWFPNAQSAYAEAIRLKPDYIIALLKQATLFTNFGPWEQAAEYYRHVLSLDPENVEAKIGEAALLEKMGEFERAYEHVRPFLDEERLNADAVTVFATICRPLKRCDEAVRLLERIIERDGETLEDSTLAALHFELGRLYDARDEFDRAFRHYARGNEIHGKGSLFDPQQKVSDTDALIKTYNADFMAKAPRATTGSRRPVFIVGMPRSGTSLVEHILASHPAVFGGGELDTLDLLVHSLPAKVGSGKISYPGCMSAAGQEEIEQMARDYLEHLATLSEDAERVTDKMPGNFVHLGMINLLFPEARVIHCVRNPLDTCLSCYFQNFEYRHSYSQDLAALGVFFREYQRLMEYWKSVLDIAFMEVRYEDMVADQERVSRELVAFCGLEWDEQCLRFYETKRAVGTASHDQVRRPIYHRSIGRWKNYESYLGPLRASLAQE
ncbi:MAG: sulfotransferase [Gammaproteobacteria bacterium]|jgi:tetratricopeptide (TPR) repeat protein